jgi:hypothetical protein
MKPKPRKPIVPHPETWDEVAWPPEEEPQLDLFGEKSPCNQSKEPAQSSRRLR